MTIEPSALSELWDERWPECPPDSVQLKFSLRDRWVRFHTLPNSKRYPDTADEYGTILDRHNTLLDGLAAGQQLLLVTTGYSNRPVPTQASPRPGAVHWTSLCDDSIPAEPSYRHLYASLEGWQSGAFDVLLREVADDAPVDVLIADPALRWLYHPYDGGADVVLSTVNERDRIRNRHRDWLPDSKSGP